MALSLVGTSTASATTIVAPSHLPGDLILIWALRGGSTTAPTLPAGWNSITTESESTATSCSARLGFRIATGVGTISSSAQNTSTGVWTTATQALVAGQIVQIEGTAPGGFSTGTNYFVLAAGLTSTTCELATAPGGTVKKPTSSSACTLDTDASGTWTNAAELCCHVYRPSSGYTLGIGQFAVAKSTSATVNYPAIALADATSGNSWVVGFTGAGNITQAISTAPSGMANESSVVGATYSAAGFDTEGGVTSWSSTNASVGGTGSTVTAVVEIMLLPKSPPAGITSHVYQHRKFAGNPSDLSATGNPYVFPIPWASGTGNTIVVKFTCDGAATVSSVEGAVNGAFTSGASALGGSGNLDTHVYIFQNVTAGQETVTITFSAAVASMEAEITELYGVVTSGGTNGTASTALSTTTATGSFTPGNNNANGGNVVLAYFADANPSAVIANIRPGPNFAQLSADTAWNDAGYSCYKSTQIYLQATSAAINPSCTVTNQGTDPWNSIALAFAVSLGAGTPPPATGIYMAGIQTLSTKNFPTTATWRFQICPMGNTRVMSCPDPTLKSLMIHDSEGNIYTDDGTGTPAFWYLLNASPNSNLEIYVDGGATDSTLSWRAFDINQQDGIPYFDSAIDCNDTEGGATTYTPSSKIAPTSTTGLALYNIGLGEGPGLGLVLPSGGVWFYATYTGEVDADLFENADLGAYYRYTAPGTITAEFDITNVGGIDSSGGIFAVAQGTPTGGNLSGIGSSLTGGEALLTGGGALSSLGGSTSSGIAQIGGGVRLRPLVPASVAEQPMPAEHRRSVLSRSL